jgi:WD40 repeat protein
MSGWSQKQALRIHDNNVEGLAELLLPQGKNVLANELCTMSTRMQILDPQFRLGHMEELINKEVGKEVARLKREEQRQLKKGLSALAVVAGARPAHNSDVGGAPDFRLGVPLGRGRSSAGLLRAGGDILQIVAGFLSWGMELQRTWMAHEGKRVNDCHFSPDGKFVLTCSNDHTLRLWRAVSGELLQTFEGHSRGILRCCFAPDGKTTLSASNDHTLKLWDLTSGALEKTLMGHQGSVVGCDFAPGGATILSGSYDGTLKLWATVSGDLQRTANVESPVISCCFSPNNGTRILAACVDSKLRLFSATTFELQRPLILQHGHGHPGTGFILSCCFSPDGNTILSSEVHPKNQTWNRDATMGLWSAHTGQLLRTLVGHSSRVVRCAFSPDGQSILSASKNGTAGQLFLWEAATGRLRQIVAEHTRIASACGFSPDGKSIVAGFGDGAVKMWR